MNRNQCKIVAPVSDLDQAARLLEAGADELYCGILERDWVRLFSDADFFTRRQGPFAHFTCWKRLKETIDLVHEAGREIALALNQRYTPVQEKYILEAARKWEELGGDSMIVADPGLLYFLSKAKSRVAVHLSLMAGVFNASAANFFLDWQVGRIILPRELAISEMKGIVASADMNLEFEALVLHQKCPFIDGMCGFYHGTRLPEKTSSTFEHVCEFRKEPPQVESHDPQYEGHGCQLRWRGPDGPVRPSCPKSEPSCAACLLPLLFKAGVSHFKLAGRGYPAEVLVSSVRFIDHAINLWSVESNRKDTRQAIKEEYVRAFGEPCGLYRCYYSI